MCKYKVGDRVNRLENIYKPKSKLMTGTIVYVYGKLARQYNINYSLPRYEELYAVRWDGSDKISYGYFPNGINKIGFTPLT